MTEVHPLPPPPAAGQVLLEGKAAPLAPAALHHCMWMAMELLGRDLWTARDQGRAFAGPRASEDVAAAGHGALRVRTTGERACAWVCGGWLGA